MKNITIQYGAVSPPLAEQVKSIGFDPSAVKHWQKDADAITRLLVRGLLSERDATNARNRLFKTMQTAANKLPH